MSTQFVPIIPGAIDDLGADHDLSWAARSMLLWLAVTVDRETGILAPVTVKAIVQATRCSWRAVKRALDELETAGAVETRLPKGHDGQIVLLWLDQIVWKKPIGKRGSTRGNRASTLGNRASAIGNRASAIRSRASTVANRDNGHKEREEDRRSSTFSQSAPDGPPAGAVDPGAFNHTTPARDEPADGCGTAGCDGRWHGLDDPPTTCPQWRAA